MSYLQREYVRENVGMTLNDTYLLDLPKSGRLMSLLIRITGSQVSGYGQGEAAWRIIDKISKLEVLGDGSEIIKSLTGYQVQALAFYDQGITSPDKWRNYATNMQQCYLLVNFGRWMGDVEMGLDLGRFSNVELRLTNTATAASHFSDLTVSILGYYLREPGGVPYLGYIRSEEWRAWTTVQDETQYLELPTQLPIRRVMLRAFPDLDTDFVDKTNLNNLMDDIEYSYKTGALRVYKGGLDDLVVDNYLMHGKYALVGGAAYQLADDGIDISLGQAYMHVGSAGSQDGAGAATIATLETSRNGPALKSETYEADSPINVMAQGAAYHLTALLRHDFDPNPATWLNPGPSGMGNVLLNIHTRDSSSSANGNNSVVLERLVR
ncbi:hypothetical protein LCGC14_2568860 [marine sediment metagenome]|uniref:Uncharacterized protein n=1 Tax=marine sediment metagenome TaxID=412755 RepID=A0A0F9B5M4_9ZZZZ